MSEYGRLWEEVAKIRYRIRWKTMTVRNRLDARSGSGYDDSVMTTRSAADVQALLAVLKKRDDAFGVADDPELQAAAAEAAASGFEQARTSENLRGWVNALSASIALGTPLEVLRNHAARLKTVPDDLTRDGQTAERLHALLTALQQEPPRLRMPS